MTDSDALAEFATSVTLESAPPAVVEKLKTTLLHSLGMVRAGSGIAAAGLALADAYDGPRSASLLHDGRKAHRDRAVLANAAMMHARTQDDTHLPAITHLAATCLPALIAVAEGDASSGPELLTGMLVSYEVGSAVAVDAGPACSSRGFRPSSVLGGVAASAGAARLMKLGHSAVASAIGLAASFGGGTNQTWVAGTDEWQYQVGVAGRNGILAAELAAADARGAAESLEGKAGLYRAFTGTPTPHSSPMDLGVHWRTLEVTYKPFPVCAINQMPVTVLLAMMDQLGFAAADIDSAQLRLSPPEAAYPGTDSYGPFAGPTAALMSAPFCLAAAARERTVTRAVVQAFDDKDVLALSDRIKVVGDGTLKPGECVIVVEGRRGRFRSDQIATPPPFDWEFDEVYRRLVDMGPELGMERPALDGLADCLRDLENRSVRDLIAAVTA
jgi:2-methylcitrate dehydratase PrpD